MIKAMRANKNRYLKKLFDLGSSTGGVIFSEGISVSITGLLVIGWVVD